MRANRRSFIAMALSAAASVLLLAESAAADYPERPITMIVAFPPGGSTDQTARLLATFLQPELGENASIVVENRAGAGGDTGFRALATAEPDGYTIGFINTPNVLTIPIERKTRYDWHSYDLLGNVIDDPGNFSIQSESEIKSLADHPPTSSSPTPPASLHQSHFLADACWMERDLHARYDQRGDGPD